MELLIDGQPVSPPPGFRALGPMIDQVLQEKSKGRRVTARVWVNGEELGDRALESLAERRADRAERVEVETQPVEVVARRARIAAVDYARNIADALGGAAEQYRGGNPSAAGDALAECADALVVLLETLRSSDAFLAGAAEPVFETLEAAVAPALQSLEALQRAEDWLGIADLLEYEMADALRAWAAREVDRAAAPEDGA